MPESPEIKAWVARVAQAQDTGAMEVFEAQAQERLSLTEPA